MAKSSAKRGAAPRRAGARHGTRPVARSGPLPPSVAAGGAGARQGWWSPLDATTALLGLRAFLGVTFVFAGLQKLANPDFFRAGAPGSIQSQLQGALHSAAFPAMVRPELHAPVFFGAAIAVAELAVGLGTLLGLWARVAALGGLALSLIFFLTVSFQTWPYYYGADIVFVFAWTPLVLAAPAPWSLDAAIERATRRDLAVPAAAPLDPEVSRRLVLRKGALAGVLAAVGLGVAGATAAIGRAAFGSGPSLTPTGKFSAAPTTTAPTNGSTPTTAGSGTPAGTPVGAASQVPVGGASQFTDPRTQSPAFVLQFTAGHFTALSAVCTHAGCLVQFSQPDESFFCPCHGSVFDARTGRPSKGPATSPLPRIAVVEGADGQLYAQD